MSTSYGVKSKLVTTEDVLRISTGNLQMVETGNSSNGAFYATFYPTGGGCGQPTQLVLFIQLKEAVPNWKKISYQFNWAGVASCWGFNAAGTQLGVDTNGNLLSFDTGLGDKYFKAKNCFELPPFQVPAAIVSTRCDNVPTNILHSSYKSGNFREFYTLRRRNSQNSPAGPAMYLSCNQTGVPITISNIFIQ